jgi:hypothetical protein
MIVSSRHADRAAHTAGRETEVARQLDLYRRRRPNSLPLHQRIAIPTPNHAMRSLSPRAESGDNFGQIVPLIGLRARAS